MPSTDRGRSERRSLNRYRKSGDGCDQGAGTPPLLGRELPRLSVCPFAREHERRPGLLLRARSRRVSHLPRSPSGESLSRHRFVRTRASNPRFFAPAPGPSRPGANQGSPALPNCRADAPQSSPPRSARSAPVYDPRWGRGLDGHRNRKLELRRGTNAGPRRPRPRAATTPPPTAAHPRTRRADQTQPPRRSRNAPNCDRRGTRSTRSSRSWIRTRPARSNPTEPSTRRRREAT